MNTEGFKCKCGCGESVPLWADYVSGHDLKHRTDLIDRAGGVDKLIELLTLVEVYMAGEVGEAELTKGIRRLRME